MFIWYKKFGGIRSNIQRVHNLPKRGCKFLISNTKFFSLNEAYDMFDQILANGIFRKKKIGKSVLQENIIVLEKGNDPSLLFIGCHHGDERAAATSILEFGRLIADEKIRIHKSVSFGLLPILNPDGYRLNTRFNFNNLDLNREYKNNIRDEALIAAKYVQNLNLKIIFDIHTATNRIVFPSCSKTEYLKLLNFAHIISLYIQRFGYKKFKIGSYLDFFSPEKGTFIDFCYKMGIMHSYLVEQSTFSSNPCKIDLFHDINRFILLANYALKLSSLDNPIS